VKFFWGEALLSAKTDDNTAAIEVAHNSKLNDRSKHIDVTYHFAQEKINESVITLLSILPKTILQVFAPGLWCGRLTTALCTEIFGTEVSTGVWEI